MSTCPTCGHETDLLTARQKDVLRHLAEGDQNKVIARKLGLGEKTIKTHVSNMMRKLKVQSRTQVVVKAIREGLVEL